jgi:hypothetical protein
MGERETVSSMTYSSIKLGLICRADNGGLGAQTHDLYTHLKPHKTLVIDIEHLTGYPNDFSKYPDAKVVKGFEPQNTEIDSFLEGLDVVFTVECPYNHYLYAKAREMGVKTVEQFNFEWSAYHQSPKLPKPDLLLAPSTWRMEEMEKYAPVKYLHVPVDREKFQFKTKHEAKKFLHIAGHRTFGDRNGTAILLEALPYIRSDVEIVIRTQDDLPRAYTDHKLTITKQDVADRRDLYNDEDVLILPRKYGGLSLQLNEALSLGMPALMLNIPPQADFLPTEWLIDATLKEQQMIKLPIDVYECTPKALAEKIDEFANLSTLRRYSEVAGGLSHDKDWRVMKVEYEDLFNELVDNNTHS